MSLRIFLHFSTPAESEGNFRYAHDHQLKPDSEARKFIVEFFG